MNILVLNGSPKGKTSATLHTALYLEALHTEHTFEYLPVAVRIKSYEIDFAPARAALERADLVLFCYPVYTFLAPCQLHRFVELIKADGGTFRANLPARPPTLSFTPFPSGTTPPGPCSNALTTGSSATATGP